MLLSSLDINDRLQSFKSENPLLEIRQVIVILAIANAESTTLTTLISRSTKGYWLLLLYFHYIQHYYRQLPPKSHNDRQRPLTTANNTRLGTWQIIGPRNDSEAGYYT
jgi:hypothetical protein